MPSKVVVACKFVCVSVSRYVCVCVFISVCVWMCMCMCMCLCMSVCVCVSLFTRSSLSLCQNALSGDLPTWISVMTSLTYAAGRDLSRAHVAWLSCVTLHCCLTSPMWLRTYLGRCFQLVVHQGVRPRPAVSRGVLLQRERADEHRPALSSGAVLGSGVGEVLQLHVCTRELLPVGVNDLHRGALSRCVPCSTLCTRITQTPCTHVLGSHTSRRRALSYSHPRAVVDMWRVDVGSMVIAPVAVARLLVGTATLRWHASPSYYSCLCLWV